MKTFKHYLRLAAAIGILSFTLLLTNAEWVVAQATKITQVFVTNTSSNPVPTAAQGTTTVGGTVNAAQSGSWNVGFTATPDVNVANMPTVDARQSGVWMVDVNGIALVRDVDHAARNRYDPGGTLGVNIPDMKNGGFADGFSNFLVVPAGKRLVIEYVSGSGFTPTGQTLSVGLVLPGIAAAYEFVPAKWGGDGFNDFFVLSQATRLYADPGSIRVAVRRVGTTGTADFQVTVSGYLVDFP